MTNPRRWGLGGLELPLYRWPDLIDWRQVLLVEGEKSVERLRQLGFAATCSPIATEWRDEYPRMLWQAGAVEVCVLPVNDRIGKAVAMREVTALHRYRPPLDSLLTSNPESPWMDWPYAKPDDPEVAPLEVKLIELRGLPHKGDVVDWFESGHTADELRTLIHNTPVWNPELQEKDCVDRARQKGRERSRRFRQRQREKREPLKCRPVS